MLDVAVKAVIFLSHLGFRLEYLLNINEPTIIT